ncbi:unnamed protein product [Closterium sp. NIES-64]|nr:unnamed protein product [Closterium sp. NIES-64]
MTSAAAVPSMRLALSLPTRGARSRWRAREEVARRKDCAGERRRRGCGSAHVQRGAQGGLRVARKGRKERRREGEGAGRGGPGGELRRNPLMRMRGAMRGNGGMGGRTGVRNKGGVKVMISGRYLCDDSSCSREGGKGGGRREKRGGGGGGDGDDLMDFHFVTASGESEGSTWIEAVHLVLPPVIPRSSSQATLDALQAPNGTAGMEPLLDPKWEAGFKSTKRVFACLLLLGCLLYIAAFLSGIIVNSTAGAPAAANTTNGNPPAAALPSHASSSGYSASSSGYSASSNSGSVGGVDGSSVDGNYNPNMSLNGHSYLSGSTIATGSSSSSSVDGNYHPDISLNGYSYLSDSATTGSSSSSSGTSSSNVPGSSNITGDSSSGGDGGSSRNDVPIAALLDGMAASMLTSQTLWIAMSYLILYLVIASLGLAGAHYNNVSMMSLYIFIQTTVTIISVLDSIRPFLLFCILLILLAIHIRFHMLSMELAEHVSYSPSTNPPSTNPPSLTPPFTNPPSLTSPSTNPPSLTPPSTNPPSLTSPSTNPSSLHVPPLFFQPMASPKKIQRLRMFPGCFSDMLRHIPVSRFRVSGDPWYQEIVVRYRARRTEEEREGVRERNERGHGGEEEAGGVAAVGVGREESREQQGQQREHGRSQARKAATHVGPVVEWVGKRGGGRERAGCWLATSGSMAACSANLKRVVLLWIIATGCLSACVAGDVPSWPGRKDARRTSRELSDGGGAGGPFNVFPAQSYLNVLNFNIPLPRLPQLPFPLKDKSPLPLPRSPPLLLRKSRPPPPEHKSPPPPEHKSPPPPKHKSPPPPKHKSLPAAQAQVAPAAREEVPPSARAQKEDLRDVVKALGDAEVLINEGRRELVREQLDNSVATLEEVGGELQGGWVQEQAAGGMIGLARVEIMKAQALFQE